MVFPHYLDEAYEVLYNPAHRWFYKQGLKDDDVILFKLADTAESVAKRKLPCINEIVPLLMALTECPHCAIIDPSVPKDTPERTSIEVRAIALG